MVPSGSVMYKTAVAHIEKGLGTLPVFFDKVSLLTFAQVEVPHFQATGATLDGQLQLDTYFWYGGGRRGFVFSPFFPPFHNLCGLRMPQAAKNPARRLRGYAMIGGMGHD